MIKIKISTEFPECILSWPLTRQIPGSSGIWNNCQFFVDQEIEECDFWVVVDNLSKPEKTLCPKENMIFITEEPPSIRNYSHKFLEQFDTVITCHKNIKHKNVIYSQQGLPWYIYLGIKPTKNYDEIKPRKYFEKTKLLSVISSTKNYTEGHRKRLEFVKKLKNHFGSQLDVFGDGINRVKDKCYAIEEYKYHIVLENSSYPDYWTEKLADAYLGESYPFYFGCPNLSDYFSEDSFTYIDINNFEKSVKIIENAIENNLYEKSIEQIFEAKDLVLDKYNLFAMISEVCNKKELQNNKTQITLKPQSFFSGSKKSPLKKLYSKIKNNILYKN